MIGGPRRSGPLCEYLRSYRRVNVNASLSYPSILDVGHHLAGMGCCKVLILVAVTLSLVNSVLSFRHEAVPDASLDTQDAALLEVFQVYPPPLSSTNRRGSTTCSYTLMNHVFSNSAGRPYIGKHPIFTFRLIQAHIGLSVATTGTLRS